MKSFRACFCLYRILSKNCRAKKTAATGECVDFRTGFHSAVPRAFGAKPQKFDCAQNDPFGVRAVAAEAQTAATPHLPRKHHAPARAFLRFTLTLCIFFRYGDRNIGVVFVVLLIGGYFVARMAHDIECTVDSVVENADVSYQIC